MEAAPYLAVARLSKPHGLKGEVVVLVLTDRPDEVFVPGRVLTPLDEGGAPSGPTVTIERGRPFHRRWLVKFRGVATRPAVQALGPLVLGVLAEELEEPADGEMYVHEVAGSTVMVKGAVVGVAQGVIEVPGGRLLAVDRQGREVLIPFRPPILVRMDRARREIVIDPPPGLLEL